MTREALLRRASQLAEQLGAIAAILDPAADEAVVIESIASEIGALAEHAQQEALKAALSAARYQQRHAAALKPAYNIRTHIDTKFNRHARGDCRCAA